MKIGRKFRLSYADNFYLTILQMMNVMSFGRIDIYVTKCPNPYRLFWAAARSGIQKPLPKFQVRAYIPPFENIIYNCRNANYLAGHIWTFITIATY